MSATVQCDWCGAVIKLDDAHAGRGGVDWVHVHVSSLMRTDIRVIRSLDEKHEAHTDFCSDACAVRGFSAEFVDPLVTAARSALGHLLMVPEGLRNAREQGDIAALREALRCWS